MNGIRWTTGTGIAVGGVAGAIAGLMGAPAPLPPAVASAPVGIPALESNSVPPSGWAEPVVASSPAVSTEASPLADADSIAPRAAVAASPVVTPPVIIAPPSLEVPTTREALLRAEMVCDQRKDFDECARAALALETGATGPADARQAKRFRRLALTHLVTQCEVDSPHACFVLAAKYRAGIELASNPTSASALEKRGAELCRLGRTAPECPAP